MVTIDIACSAIAVAVGISVGVPGQYVSGAVFVDGSVAVVVDAVTVFGCGWIDGGVCVVAVGVVNDVCCRLLAALLACGAVAVGVGIGVGVPGGGVDGGAFIDGSVTVVVDAVAVFGCGWIDLGVGVVAVGVVRDVSGGLIAIDVACRTVAVSVGVIVDVPGRYIDGAVFIDVAIAVVVDAVADFTCGRIDPGV